MLTFVRVLAVLVVVLAACQQGDPKLSTDVQGLVIVNPSTPHDFGSLQVGQTSAPFTVTISPSGTSSYDRIDSVSAPCPDFSAVANTPAEVYRTCETCCPAGQQICPQSPLVCCIGDQQSFSFQTYFSPTVSGTSSCVVTISLNNGASTKTVTLTGTGTPPPVEIDVHPTSVGFGDVRRDNDSTAVAITVSNLGGSPLNVGSASVSSASSVYRIVAGQTGMHSISAGSSETYSIVCRPTAVGQTTGTFDITSNDSDEMHVSIPLSCNGIDSNLVILPSPVNLTARVGEPVQKTITLQNTGQAGMQIENVSVTGQDLSMVTPPATSMIPGGGNMTTLTIGFAATSAGTATGDLVVTYDSGQTRTAGITALALNTSMSLTPDGDIDFGPVCSGQTAPKEFSIHANDLGSFEVNTISTPDAPFTVTAPPLPANVQGNPGNTVTFTVTASPTAAGHQVSTMVVDTDIPGGTPHMINLAVDGLDAGVSAIPASVDFGANPIQTTTIGQEVHLSNCSAAAITAMNARIEGPDAADFAIVQQPDNTMIDPTGNADWLVVLQAHTSGTKQASFVVDYDGGTVTVPLAGEGLGNAPGDGAGGGGEKSYYTCAAGGASSAWPLVLIGLALTVRRRRSAAPRS